jgi:radical SAM protein with 4Fe4S-binding SPASM domain
MKQNIGEVDAFTEFWRAQGAEVKVRPMLEWTGTGSVRTETIVHGSEFRIACPWSNSTMAIHQDGRVVACAVDYEGRFTAGDVKSESIADIWARLRVSMRDPQRAHQWERIPEICRTCGDWQAAGATYEGEQVAGTRPFWYYESEPR